MQKSLEDMSLEELWHLFPIQLREYNKNYPVQYSQESKSLKLILGDKIHRISHIGSTSVPGLISKPIVDILIETESEDDTEISRALTKNGWRVMNNQKEPFRIDLNKGYTQEGFAEKIFHLHIVRIGDNDELYFRDYLLEHPEVQIEYASLKESLLPKFQNNRDGYTDAKTEFIKKVLIIAKSEYLGRYNKKQHDR